MPVAKSYQTMKVLGETFTENGRTYVMVQGKNGARKVRWYTDAEYLKMYPGEKIDHSNDPYWKSQKETLGFKNGFIWIATGQTYEVRDWFKEHDWRYARWWGWYYSSENPEPTDVPEGVVVKKLDWDLIKKDDENVADDAAIAAAVESIVYNPGTSEWNYNVGDKVSISLIVTKNIPLESYYGISHMHIMEDEDGNIYVWTTQAKDWEEGSEHFVTGTVKELKTYRNIKQTVLTRCKEK